jgi:catechol 2,3-dioxygenase-like lactoylglutathione lyase family enzyme
MLQIKLTSVLVEDQARALAFYTDVLGFKKATRFSGRRVSLDHR